MRTAIAIGLAALSVAWPRCTTAERRSTAAVTLRIHDYAGVPSYALGRAQQLVTAFYDRVGVRTRWAPTVARTVAGGRGPLQRSGPLEDVTVIVLSGPMADRKDVDGREVLGFAAIPDQPPGRVAYVVYERVDAAANDSDWTLADLLSVVIAHEVGHLYLPPGSHSAGGLMRGNWSIAELRRTDPRHLRFTATQAELMRAGIGEPPAADDGPGPQIVGELRTSRER
jgi:hypothetical protein